MPELSKTMKYTRPYAIDRNTFIEEYYSSVDLTIEVNGEEFKEAKAISFNVQEQIKPIYSYGSSTFDDVAIGNRIVVGSLIVPVSNKLDNDISNPTGTYLDINTEYVPGWVEANKTMATIESAYEPVGGRSRVGDGIGARLLDEAPSYSIISENNTSYINLVQEKLTKFNYNITVNGILDAKTRKAIIDYQEKNFLKITGNITDELIQSLKSNKELVIQTDSYLYPSDNLKFPSIKKLNKGESVMLISQNGVWAKVKYKHLTGFIQVQ